MKTRTWSMVSLRTWLLLPCKTSPNALGKETSKANISGSTSPFPSAMRVRPHKRNAVMKMQQPSTYCKASRAQFWLKQHILCAPVEKSLLESRHCTGRLVQPRWPSSCQELQLLPHAEPCQNVAAGVLRAMHPGSLHVHPCPAILPGAEPSPVASSAPNCPVPVMKQVYIYFLKSSRNITLCDRILSYIPLK